MTRPLNTTSIRQIEAFMAMIRARSVSVAAQQMNVAQPGVSRLLREFEASVGFQLFERRKRRLYPTPEALLLYDEVVKYFRGLEAIAHAAADIRNLSRGRLRLGSFLALSLSVIPAAIRQLNDRTPQAGISCTVNQSRQIVELVASGMLDIGVVDPVAVGQRARIEAVFTTDCVCAVPRDHPFTRAERISLEMLRGENVIGLEREFFLRHPAGKTLYEELSPNLLLHTRQSLTACALVAEGLGVAIVDPFTARYCAAQGIVARPLSSPIPFEAAIISSMATPLPNIAKVFLEAFHATLKAQGSKISFTHS